MYDFSDFINRSCRHSSVSTVTHYGLDGARIESRCWVDTFRTRQDRTWGPPSLLHNGCRFFFSGVSGRGVALTTHPNLSPMLKKEYSYTSTPPLLAFVSCYRVNLSVFNPSLLCCFFQDPNLSVLVHCCKMARV